MYNSSQMNVIKLKKAVNILKLQNIALLALVNLKLIKKQNKKLRRWWVKPHLFPEIRDAIGAYAMVCQYFTLNDHEEFERHFKLTVGNFDNLYHLVGNKLKKIHSLLRAPIPPYIRLALTLHYLAHGGSVKVNSLYYRVGKSTYYTIVPETCKAISDVLIPIYMKFPDKEDWIHIAQDFERKWNFPNCIGALDGKHMRIKRPCHGGSIFFNYKKFHSIVLMAISDAHCRFIWFTLGDGGSFSDSSVFSNSAFYEKLLNNDLQIPAPTKLPNSDQSSPFVFISDEIFRLEKNLMKPFNRKLLRTEREKIFNYRLSRARFTIECAFGILCSKWQLLNNALGYKLITIKYIISACLILHNFLITSNLQNINYDVKQLEFQNAENCARNPIFIRKNLMEYFNHEGAVQWQNNYI